MRGWSEHPSQPGARGAQGGGRGPQGTCPAGLCYFSAQGDQGYFGAVWEEPGAGQGAGVMGDLGKGDLGQVGGPERKLGSCSGLSGRRMWRDWCGVRGGQAWAHHALDRTGPRGRRQRQGSRNPKSCGTGERRPRVKGQGCSRVDGEGGGVGQREEGGRWPQAGENGGQRGSAHAAA